MFVKRSSMLGAILVGISLLGCDAGAPQLGSLPEGTGNVQIGEDETVHIDNLEERARIIREAEDFVSAQGYTDAPPSVSGDAVVREWIEGSLADRRGMLEPRALRAYASGAEWVVLFRYQDPQYAGLGRALELRAGQTPSFVHQDMVLDPGSHSNAVQK